MSHSPESQPGSAWPVVDPKLLHLPLQGACWLPRASHCPGSQRHRSGRPYLLPEEQDLLREELGEALRCEERLEAREERPVLLQEALREPGLRGELRAAEGSAIRFFSSEEPRHEGRHAL